MRQLFEVRLLWAILAARGEALPSNALERMGFMMITDRGVHLLHVAFRVYHTIKNDSAYQTGEVQHSVTLAESLGRLCISSTSTSQDARLVRVGQL